MKYCRAKWQTHHHQDERWLAGCCIKDQRINTVFPIADEVSYSYIEQRELSPEPNPYEQEQGSCDIDPDSCVLYDQTRVTTYSTDGWSFDDLESKVTQWSLGVLGTYTYVHDSGENFIFNDADDNFFRQEDLGRECPPDGK